MTTLFSLTRDINGYNGFGRRPADDKSSVTLSASTDTTVSVPAGTTIGSGHSTVVLQWLAIFSYTPGSSVWVANNATAAVPAGATFASTTSSLNPTCFQVKTGDVLHFISGVANTSVGVEFYALL